ncbi:MAG: aminopeptidase P family protein [Opitutales bacterium]|nr:aminopeptidase P family protein [Opitutales bacterium]
MATKKSSSSPKPKTGVLLYADTDRSADALYFGQVSVPDAFIAFSDGKKRCAIVSALEFNRVRHHSAFDEVLSLETELKRAPKGKSSLDRLAAIVRNQAKERGITTFRVAADFPAGLAFALRSARVGLEIADGLLFPEREFKTDEEAAHIRRANEAAAAGFRAVMKTLREAKIGPGGKLLLGKNALTSEKLHEIISIACLEKGAIAGQPIAAGGDQACDPHHRGSGPLRANELIIVDIFPRDRATGYHGDMTRTFLKGRASEAQRALVATVFEAQQAALRAHKARTSGMKIYKDVVALFKKHGYETKTENGLSTGFFHGLGHGLGLEVHEPPRVNAKGSGLRAGQVITVEPGLYYTGLGGCRIEDVVRVTNDSPEMLSTYPYKWEIR